MRYHYGKPIKYYTIYFGKKHWKGIVLLNVVLVGAELAWHKYGSNVTKLDFGKKSKKK